MKMFSLLFGVILFHCYRPFIGVSQYWAVGITPTDDFKPFIDTLYSLTKLINTPMLFFASGFLYVMVMSTKNRPVLEQLFKRSKRIIVPYLIIGSLYVVPAYILSNVGAAALPKDTSLIDGYLQFFTLKFCDHLWFLQVMLFITVICLSLNFLFKKKLYPIMLVLSFGLAFVFDYLFSNCSIAMFAQISFNLFLFVLGGAFFYLYYLFTNKVTSLVLLLSLVGLYYTFPLNAPYGTTEQTFYLTVKYSFACSAFFCFAKFVGDAVMSVLYKSKFIQFFDKNFMDFYLYHMPLPLIFACYAYPIFSQYVESQFLYVVFAFVGTLSITTVLVLISNKIKKIYRAMTSPDVKNS